MLQDEEAASRQQAIATLSAHAYDEPAITAITAALKDPAPKCGWPRPKVWAK